MDSLNGICANGLLAGASGLILGEFHLGGFGIQVLPPQAPTINGGGAIGGPPIYYEDVKARRIRFYLTVKDKTYDRTFHVSEGIAGAVLRTMSVVNKVKSEIQIKVGSIRKK